MRVFISACMALYLCVLASLAVADNAAGSVQPAVASGYGKLPYDLPDVGSYTLPVLGEAANAKVIDEASSEAELHQLYDNKYIVLSFIYSNCKDVNGCPLSSYVMYQLKRAMQKDPVLAERLKLISVSFDPKRDTPEVMKLYANNFKFAGEKGEWRFLTTASEAKLAPLLKAYKQEIQREVSINGEETDDYSHLLRVFLIDPERKIRNIYSVGFLHADLILNDLNTLFLADSGAEKLKIHTVKQVQSQGNHRLSPTALEEQKSDSVVTEQMNIAQPGDFKQGYESGFYQTQARALTERKGKRLDLYALSQMPPLGLPNLEKSQQAILSPAKIALGKKLFYDRRLSLNNTISCAMCHIPDHGFTNNEIAMAVGFEGRTVKRNTPSLYNSAYAKSLFHDGREDSLEQQVWQPLLNENEMANPSIGSVINKLKQFTDYRGLFEAAFEGKGADMITVGQALAAYEITLLSANSPFDRWFYAKDETAINESAKRGFRLFTGKAQCSSCHTVGKQYSLFTDHQLHNTGLGFKNSMGDRSKKQRVTVAPGMTLEVDRSIINTVAEKTPNDLGRYEVTQNPKDRWHYKTPGLRNVALTSPYMHDGSMSTLESVVRFYNDGGVPNLLLSSLIKPLDLSETEIADLVSFLRALTGDNVQQIVADAFAEPVGDTGSLLKANKTKQAESEESSHSIKVDRKPLKIEKEYPGNITLTHHHGEPFELKQLRGKWVLMMFGYTSCPGVCPMELAAMTGAVKDLGELGKEVQVVMVSVDPERDSVDAMHQYVSLFPVPVIGLTGNAQALATAAEKYAVNVKIPQHKAGEFYHIDHTSHIFVLNPQGETVQLIPFGLPRSHIKETMKHYLN